MMLKKKQKNKQTNKQTSKQIYVFFRDTGPGCIIETIVSKRQENTSAPLSKNTHVYVVPASQRNLTACSPAPGAQVQVSNYRDSIPTPTPSPTSPPTPSPTAVPDAYLHVGCYGDSSRHRVLSGVSVKRDPVMTTEVCSTVSVSEVAWKR